MYFSPFFPLTFSGFDPFSVFFQRVCRTTKTQATQSLCLAAISPESWAGRSCTSKPVWNLQVFQWHSFASSHSILFSILKAKFLTESVSDQSLWTLWTLWFQAHNRKGILLWTMHPHLISTNSFRTKQILYLCPAHSLVMLCKPVWMSSAPPTPGLPGYLPLVCVDFRMSHILPLDFT